MIKGLLYHTIEQFEVEIKFKLVTIIDKIKAKMIHKKKKEIMLLIHWLGKSETPWEW